MQFLKSIAKLILCAVASAGVGGIGGGFAFMFVELVPIAIKGGGMVGGVIFALLGALSAGVLMGSVFGLFFGFVPTFLTGLALVQLSRWDLFRSMWIWALVGAAVGAITAALLPDHAMFSSKVVWIAGGAAAMMAYQAISVRIAFLHPLIATASQQR